MARIAPAALLLVACSGAGTGPAAPGSRRPPPPLVELLPPEPDWVLLAEPTVLWDAPEIRRALSGSVLDADFARYAEKTGVDVRFVEEAVVAGYHESVLWLARGGLDPADVRRRLEGRLHPVLRRRRRDLRGVLGETRAGLRLVGPRVVAYCEGDARPLDRIARRGASDREMRALAKRLGPEPLRFLHPGPPELPPESGAGLLLSRIRRMGFGLEPTGGSLNVRILLSGELPDSASENLSALVRSVGSSALGRAFGADRAARRAGITVTPGGAELRLRLDPDEVDTGVRTLFVDDLRGLVEGT